MKKRFRLQQSISSFVVVCFLTTNAMAMPAETVLYSAPSAAREIFIKIPAKMGSIVETYAAQAKSGTTPRTVIYIQDAHDSLEAQENIAAMIWHVIKEYGVHTVYEEGCEGPVPTDQLFNKVRDPVLREKISYYLMDKLRVGGAEYAHINRAMDQGPGLASPGAGSISHGNDFDLMGADSISLHLENIRAYEQAAKKQGDITQDIQRIRNELQKLMDRDFPKEVKEWLKLKEWYVKGEMPLIQYLERAYKILETKTGKLKRQRVTSPSFTSIEAILSGDEKKIKKIHPEGLLKEIKRFEEEIAEAGLPSERDRKTYGYYQSILLLEKLNLLQLSEEEYAALKDSLESLKTEDVARFIAGESFRAVVLFRSWEELITDSINFYELAKKRDAAIRGALSGLSGKGEAPAVLVFGGFHKEAIKKVLKDNDISYVIVSPAIGAPSKRHENYYRMLMSGGGYAFEKQGYGAQTMGSGAPSVESNMPNENIARESTCPQRAVTMNYISVLGRLAEAGANLRSETRDNFILKMDRMVDTGLKAEDQPEEVESKKERSEVRNGKTGQDNLLPDYPGLQQEVRNLSAQQGQVQPYLSPADFFRRPFRETLRDPNAYLAPLIVFADHLDVDAFVSTLSMSYLLYVMTAVTGRGQIPVIPLLRGNRLGIDPSIISILEKVFGNAIGAEILQALPFTDEEGDVEDLQKEPRLVQVDSSGAKTWLTIDHHSKAAGAEPGLGSRIEKGTSAAFLISQEYLGNGLPLDAMIAWMTLYSVMSDTVFFTENMIGSNIYKAMIDIILPVIRLSPEKLPVIFDDFKKVIYDISHETPLSMLRDTKSTYVEKRVLVSQRFFIGKKKFFDLVPGIVREMKARLSGTGRKVWFFIGTDVEERISYVFAVVASGQRYEETVQKILKLGGEGEIGKEGVRIYKRPEMLRKNLMENISPSLSVMLQRGKVPAGVSSPVRRPEPFMTQRGIVQYAWEHRREYSWANVVYRYYDPAYREEFFEALKQLLVLPSPALRHGAAWICAQPEWIGPIDIPATRGWEDRSLLTALHHEGISDGEFFKQWDHWYKDFSAKASYEAMELLYAEVLGVFKNEKSDPTRATNRAVVLLSDHLPFRSDHFRRSEIRSRPDDQENEKNEAGTKAAREEVVMRNPFSINNPDALADYIEQLVLEINQREQNGQELSLPDIIREPQKHGQDFYEPLYELFLARISTDFDGAENFITYSSDILLTKGVEALRKMMEQPDSPANIALRHFKKIKPGKNTSQASVEFYGQILFFLTGQIGSYLGPVYDAIMATRPGISLAREGISYHSRAESTIRLRKKGVLYGTEAASANYQQFRDNSFDQVSIDMEGRKGGAHASKIAKAIAYWKEQAEKLNSQILRDRIAHFEASAVVVEFDSELPFIVADTEHNAVRILHTERLTHAFNFSTAFLESLNINNPQDMKELAVWLNIGQEWLDVYSDMVGNIPEDSVGDDLTSVIEAARAEINLHFFDIEDSRLIPVESQRKTWPAGIVDLTLERRLAARMKAHVLKRYERFLSSVIEENEEAEKLLEKALELQSKDPLAYGTAQQRYDAREPFASAHVIYRKLLNRYESMGMYAHAEKIFRRLVYTTAGVQLYDDGGLLPHFLGMELIFTALRLGFWDDFLNELEIAWTGRPDPERGIKAEILQGKLRRGYPRKLTTINVDESERYLGNEWFATKLKYAMKAQLLATPAAFFEEKERYAEKAKQLLSTQPLSILKPEDIDPDRPVEGPRSEIRVNGTKEDNRIKGSETDGEETDVWRAVREKVETWLKNKNEELRRKIPDFRLFSYLLENANLPLSHKALYLFMGTLFAISGPFVESSKFVVIPAIAISLPPLLAAPISVVLGLWMGSILRNLLIVLPIRWLSKTFLRAPLRIKSILMLNFVPLAGAFGSVIGQLWMIMREQYHGHEGVSLWTLKSLNRVISQRLDPGNTKLPENVRGELALLSPELVFQVLDFQRRRHDAWNNRRMKVRKAAHDYFELQRKILEEWPTLFIGNEEEYEDLRQRVLREITPKILGRISPQRRQKIEHEIERKIHVQVQREIEKNLSRETRERFKRQLEGLIKQEMGQRVHDMVHARIQRAILQEARRLPFYRLDVNAYLQAHAASQGSVSGAPGKLEPEVFFKPLFENDTAAGTVAEARRSEVRTEDEADLERQLFLAGENLVKSMSAAEKNITRVQDVWGLMRDQLGANKRGNGPQLKIARSTLQRFEPALKNYFRSQGFPEYFTERFTPAEIRDGLLEVEKRTPGLSKDLLKIGAGENHGLSFVQGDFRVKIPFEYSRNPSVHFVRYGRPSHVGLLKDQKHPENYIVFQVIGPELWVAHSGETELRKYAAHSGKDGFEEISMVRDAAILAFDAQVSKPEQSEALKRHHSFGFAGFSVYVSSGKNQTLELERPDGKVYRKGNEKTLTLSTDSWGTPKSVLRLHSYQGNAFYISGIGWKYPGSNTVYPLVIGKDLSEETKGMVNLNRIVDMTRTGELERQLRAQGNRQLVIEGGQIDRASIPNPDYVAPGAMGRRVKVSHYEITSYENDPENPLRLYYAGTITGYPPGDPHSSDSRSEARSLKTILTEQFSGGDQVSFIDLDTGLGAFIPAFRKFLEMLGYRIKRATGTEPLKDVIAHGSPSVRPDIVHANAQIPEDFRRFEKHFFDIVTVNNIESAPWALAARAHELLKPGGVFLVTIEENDVIDGREDGIVGELKRAGFEVTSQPLPSDYPSYETLFKSAKLLVAVVPVQRSEVRETEGVNETDRVQPVAKITALRPELPRKEMPPKELRKRELPKEEPKDIYIPSSGQAEKNDGTYTPASLKEKAALQETERVIRKALEELKGKFTIVTDMADVANFTEAQLREFEVMAHLCPHVKFVFTGALGAAASHEKKNKLQRLQEELGSDRIVITGSESEDVSPSKGEKVIRILKRSTPHFAHRKDLFEFQYLANETGLVPLALLYADQHEKPSEKGMMDLSMASELLRSEIREFQNSIVFARAA